MDTEAEQTEPAAAEPAAQRTEEGGWTWLTAIGDRVLVYLGEDGEWHWRVRARNGENVGSGEGHPGQGDALTAAMRYHAPEHPATYDPIQLAPSLPDDESPWITPLPDGDLEATWPTTWFSYLEQHPKEGDPVMVGGERYVVASQRGGGRPDRVVVRLHRVEIRQPAPTAEETTSDA